jgi:cytochrome c556
MKRFVLAAAATLAGGALLGAPALAGGADQVRARVAGFRALGAAYKSANDSLRRQDIAKIRQASVQIGGAARNMQSWFPRGSGPQPGVKTAAKPEIWARPAEFRAAADAFARQAQAFQRVAAGNDMSAIRSASRALGGTCKGCHDQFKVETD